MPATIGATAVAPAVTSPRQARRRLILAIAVAALLAAATALALWAHHRSQHVVSRNATVRGQLTEVGTRLDGVLASIEAREGERVRAGQILARLDDRHLRSQEQEARALIDGLEREVELERSTIAYERLKRDTRLQEMVARSAAAQAEVAAAQSRTEEAREYHKVRAALLERQMITPEAVRDAEAKYRTALAMFDVAQANGAAANSAERSARLESDSIALRGQRIGVLVAHVQAARARLERARADLEGALIRAPGDGAVIRWLIKAGGSVEVGKPVVSMSIGRDVWIEAWVDEDEIHRIRVGSAATVTLPSHRGVEFNGVVDAVGLTTDFEQPADSVPQPRFVRMRGAPVVGVLVRLQEPPDTLLPGLSAVVAIRGENP